LRQCSTRAGYPIPAPAIVSDGLMHSQIQGTHGLLIWFAYLVGLFGWRFSMQTIVAFWFFRNGFALIKKSAHYF
jgi:hypothetical protein